MRQPLNPNRIYRLILENKITKENGIKSLTYVLNDSDESAIIQGIEVMEKLMPTFDKKICTILENLMLSDESELVRFAASKALIKIFPEKCVEPIEWAINHEKSVYFLKELIIFLETNDFYFSKDFVSLILKRVGRCYHVNDIEARFFLDFTYLIFCSFTDHCDERDEDYNKFVRENYLKLNQNSYVALLSSSSIENGHVKDLSLNGKIAKPQNLPIDDFTYSIREIPKSLSLLSKLEKLHITGFCLKSLPDSVNKLDSLKHLTIKQNYINELSLPKNLTPQVETLIFNGNKNIEKTPDFLWEFANRDSSVKKYIEEGVLPSEAPVLALLEILRGGPVLNAYLVIRQWREEDIEELGAIDTKDYSYEEISWYENRLMVYTLNNEGYVDRINTENSELPKIGIFPKYLCVLTHLRELTLVAQGIERIPDCIGHFRELEILDLSHNDIQELPLGIKKIPNLMRLKIGEKSRYNSSDHYPRILKN